MRIQVKRFLRSGIDTLQTFAVAVLVACLVSSYGKDEPVNPPEEQPIDGEIEAQPDDIKRVY